MGGASIRELVVPPLAQVHRGLAHRRQLRAQALRDDRDAEHAADGGLAEEERLRRHAGDAREEVHEHAVGEVREEEDGAGREDAEEVHDVAHLRRRADHITRRHLPSAGEY